MAPLPMKRAYSLRGTTALSRASPSSQPMVTSISLISTATGPGRIVTSGPSPVR